VSLLVSEVFVNADKGCQFGDSPPYEPYTQDRGRLFRDMQKEYGRCVSSQYLDKPDGTTQRCGWVFSKRMEYEDYRPSRGGERYYTREVWVTVHTAPDEVKRTRHIADLDSPETADEPSEVTS
jgi:hypothetical protein